MRFHLKFKIRELVRQQLDLQPTSDFVLQVIKDDLSIPYITTDRVLLKYNNKVSKKLVIVVGELWIKSQLYNEVNEVIEEYINNKLKIEYL